MKIFYQSLSIIFGDKVIFLLACIPFLVGVTLYYFLGEQIYHFVMVYGREYVGNFSGLNTNDSFLATVFFVFFMVIFIFLVNWTFVMVVLILSSPFNDLISSRVERKYTELTCSDQGSFFKNIFKIIWNECKKVIVIFILTWASVGLSFIPVLAPLHFIISSFLMSVQFIDYSWSRHDWGVGKCMKDSLKHIFSYTISGALFMFLITIPFVHLIMTPVAVVYFTLLWAKKNPVSHPVR